MMKLKKLLETSLVKTIRFNYHYFGIKYVLKPLVLISRNVKLKKLKGIVKINKRETGIVQIGYGYVGIFDKGNEKALWENNGTITFKGSAYIGLGSRIVCCGELVFGDKFTINARTNIICFEKIIFGENCLLSWNCLIIDTDFHSIYEENDEKRLNKLNENKEIIINDNVWICCNCTILKGSNIPSHCVISANSVVSKTLPKSNSIYVSNKSVKENIIWTH